MNTIKRLAFIGLWTLIFFFGSAAIIGFVFGFYLMCGAKHIESENITANMQSGAPVIFGCLGLLLGILGKLAGTKRKISNT